MTENEFKRIIDICRSHTCVECPYVDPSIGWRCKFLGLDEYHRIQTPYCFSISNGPDVQRYQQLIIRKKLNDL